MQQGSLSQQGLKSMFADGLGLLLTEASLYTI